MSPPIDSSTSESPEKPWFPRRLRELRVENRLSQKQVAEAVGVLEPTYANAESSRTRRLRGDRVQALAKFYALDEAKTAELVAGWKAMPESEYNKRNSKSWAERDEKKGKLKRHDPLCLSVIELAIMLVTSVETPGSFCDCEFDSDTSCKLCTALQLVGLRGWTTREDVIEKLAAAQEKLEKSPNTGKNAP